MNAVAKVGPVAVTVCANSFFAYHGGVFTGQMDYTPQYVTSCEEDVTVW